MQKSINEREFQFIRKIAISYSGEYLIFTSLVVNIHTLMSYAK